MTVDAAALIFFFHRLAAGPFGRKRGSNMIVSPDGEDATPVSQEAVDFIEWAQRFYYGRLI